MKSGDSPEHSTYSASGSERWLECPASIKLSEKAPPQESSVYAEEGTEGHAVLEYLLQNRDKFRGAIKQAQKLYPKEMVDHAVDAAAWILKEADYVPRREFGPELLTETRVDSSFFTTEGQFGTLDAAIVRHFDRLTVIDYKYGAGIPVDVVSEGGKANSQLVYYALGTAAMFDFNFTEVELIVIQPRAFHPSGETVRRHVMSIEELEAWIPIFQEGAARTLDKKPTVKAGKWCRYCPAAVICPKLKDEALKDARIAFSPELGVKSVPDPRMIKGEDLSIMLDAADRLEEWIHHLRERALNTLRQGGHIPGFKLVEKRAQRKWKDQNLVFAAAMRDFGQKAMKPAELLSPTQLEKAVCSDLRSKKEKGRVAQWITERTVKESSGDTMVRDSDPRIAIEGPADARKAFGVTIDVTSKKKAKDEKAKQKRS